MQVMPIIRHLQLKAPDNAVTFTAKASGASGQQFNLNSSASTTATNLANAINHSDFTASASGSVVTVAVTGGGTTTVTSGDTDRIAPNPVTEGEQAKFIIEPKSRVIMPAKVYLHVKRYGWRG